MKIKHLFYTVIISILTLGCGSDDLEAILEIPLLAIVSPEQTVVPFTEVTLDGSASTGPEGFNYQWIYNGNESIDPPSTNEAMMTFTPEKNGVYSFTLRLTTSDGKFSEALTNVQVTGAVVLDASSFVSDNLELSDVEPDGSLPDYIINADFTIPSGKRLVAGNGFIVIAVADDAGIIVQGEFQNYSSLSILPTATSWKGILVDGGYFLSDGASCVIDKSGSSIFDGQTDAGAIITTNGGELSISGIQVTNTIGDYGLIVDAISPVTHTFINNYFANVKTPIKASIDQLYNINANSFDTYEYIELMTPGAEVTLGSSEKFNFINHTYYINNDFTAGNDIIASSATIYMAEGTGIVASTGFQIVSSTLDGLNNASWKGIASTDESILSGSKLINAGSAVHNTGSFSTTEKAAFHSSAGLVQILDGSEITDSQGYGIFISQDNGQTNKIENTVFSNNADEDIALPYNMVGSTIKTGNAWSSNIPVALNAGSSSPSGFWPDLGDGISYLATVQMNIISGNLSLSPGVNIMFQSGTGIYIQGNLDAEGTVTNPITFDGEADTPGSWNGLELAGTYQMENCIINNGGQSLLSSFEKTSVLFYSGSSGLTYPQTNYKFDNNIISNSAGYGVQVHLGRYDPVTGNATNTFTSNASGDIKLP